MPIPTTVWYGEWGARRLKKNETTIQKSLFPAGAAVFRSLGSGLPLAPEMVSQDDIRMFMTGNRAAATSEAAMAATMRNADPAWRSRDLPPSPNQAYQQSKVISWLDRNKGSVDTTSMSPLGHTFLITAVVNNHESLVAELLKRGAAVNTYAQGKTALHFAVLLGHSNCSALLLRYGADASLRVMEDDSDWTECDGYSAAEIVEEKGRFARDPLRERYAEMRQQLIDAAAGREVATTAPVWGA